MNLRKAYALLALCCLMTSLRVAAQSEKVFFSAPGGFYDEPFLLELSCFYPNHRIFYTLNGNTPTVQSHEFKEPLRLDELLYSKSDIYTIQISPDNMVFVPDSVQHCIVVRAAVFDEANNRISEVVTNSYFIHSLNNDTHGLPVMSICADTLDLFDYETGIMVPGIHFDPEHPDSWRGNYYMKGREWERLSNVEFYETDNTGINQQAGLRTHGGNARRYPQKGLKIYAREEYGKKRFEHPFFGPDGLDSFKHLVLKPYRCASTAAGVQDFISCQLAKSLDFESLDTRPLVLYLNGEYWGIYYLQEKADERYLEDHLGVDVEQTDIICDWWPVTLELGSDTGYLDLAHWLENADLSQTEDYQHLCSRIDLHCFIDYYVFELFVSNQDWPSNNVRFWRENNGKWRWIFFDGDAAVCELDYDAFSPSVYVGDETWPSCTQATLFFRKLLENNDFREQFQSRFNQLLDTYFQNDSTYPILNHIVEALRDEIPNQSARFQIPYHETWWPVEIEKIRRFLEYRPLDARIQLQAFLSNYPSEPWSPESLLTFPNPFHDQLTLRFEAEEAGEQQMFVYDILGHCVHTETLSCSKGLNFITLQLNLPSGLYLLTKVEKSGQKLPISKDKQVWTLYSIIDKQ